VAFRPNGPGFALASFGGTVSVWEPGGQPLISRPLVGAPAFGGRFSPDGRVLAVPDAGAVTLYDAATLQPLGPPLRVAGGPPLSVGARIPLIIAFSRDSRRIAVAGLGATVQIFEVATLRPVGVAIPLQSPAVSLAFSPAGTLLAVGGTNHDAYLINSSTGQRRGPLQPPPAIFVLSLSFSTDGQRLLATSSVSEDVIYDHLQRPVPDGHVVPTLRGQGEWAVFSHDGKLAATSSVDGSLQFRDARTLAPRGPRIPANTSPVVGMAFSPNGRTLVTTDVTPESRFIDVASAQPIGQAIAAGGISYPSFRAGGREVVLSIPGGSAIFSFDVATWRADACRLAGRNLTKAEARDYLGGSGLNVATCPGLPTPS